MEPTIIEPNRGFEPDMAYPQYADKYCRDIVVISTNTWIKLQEYVLDKANDPLIGADQTIRKHWDSILTGVIPFGMRIVKGK